MSPPASRGARRLLDLRPGIVLPAALAAVVVVLLEGIRGATGPTQIGGFAAALGLIHAIAGLLGLPLLVFGALGLLLWRVARLGGRWGRGDAQPPGRERIAAHLTYLLLAAPVLVVSVQRATMLFVKAFKRSIYQGLGAGLVAAVAVVLLIALAPPVVRAFELALVWLRRRLPRVVDPTGEPGVWLWAGLLLLGLLTLPTVIFPELHTVDLRAPRVVLLWLALLALGARFLGPRVPLWAAASVGVIVAAWFVHGAAWSAGSLGRSQSRLLALSRGTLLAGKVSARVRKLADGDGDGIPALFAGGDCDDTNPAVRPGVFDPAEDGVDQNCTGADLVTREDPLPKARRLPPARDKKKWNVVLLTIDALRDDTARAQMPKFQRFAAQEGIDFTQAYSHGAATYWSVASLITSKMPSRIEFGGDQTPVGRERTLAEVLRDGGWHTALFANVTVFFIRGLRQGFHEANYETSHHTVHGAKPGSMYLTEQILGHLRRWKAGEVRGHADRFFVWAHYYDPHDPYFEVEGYPADGGSDRARYEAIVRYLDDGLAALFEGLKAEGLWDDTVIIVTADHGEEFLDHGQRFHGSTVYEEMTHVPLVLKVPGAKPRSLATPIGHIEVAPTLLELLGLAIPGSFSGRSRAKEALEGGAAAVEPVFLEVMPDRNYKAHVVGMRLADLKVSYRLDDHFFELYDLSVDPAETVNRWDDWPERGPIEALLLRYVDHHLWWMSKGKTGAQLPVGAAPARRAKPRRRARAKPRRRAKPRPKPALPRRALGVPAKAPVGRRAPPRGAP